MVVRLHIWLGGIFLFFTSDFVYCFVYARGCGGDDGVKICWIMEKCHGTCRDGAIYEGHCSGGGLLFKGGCCGFVIWYEGGTVVIVIAVKGFADTLMPFTKC